jgi:hypothetical protein
MPKYLITVDYHGGAIDTPMTEWSRRSSRRTWTTTTR